MGWLHNSSKIKIIKKENKISDLPNGLDDGAMIAAVAWEIVSYAYLRTAYFSDKQGDEVITKLTNEYIRARQAIYHGKFLEDPQKE